MRYTLYSENDVFLRRAFLAFPKGLYPPERQTQDAKTEKQILLGTHPLSVDFAAYPFLALDENNQPAARCLLTLCPGDENGYVGFFESEDAPDAAALVLNAAADKARLFGRSRLVGPYNASNWLGYRFKTSNFRESFTGEPNNKAFYPRLWEQCGFVVTDHYFSNHMRVQADTGLRQLKAFREAGYDFRTITFRTFDTCLEEICALMHALYGARPGFQYITEEQFVALFSPLRYVLDHEMVKLVYKDDKLAAFVICVPNCGARAAGLRSIRRAPTEYAISCVGVSPEHAGLADALSELLEHDLRCRNCTSVTPLMRDGSASGAFFQMPKTSRTDYVLMARELI